MNLDPLDSKEKSHTDVPFHRQSMKAKISLVLKIFLDQSSNRLATFSLIVLKDLLPMFTKSLELVLPYL